MLVLWQYHAITGVGNAEIINRANNYLEHEYLMALSVVEAGKKTVTSVKDATEYFENNELGSVSEFETSEREYVAILIHGLVNMGIPYFEAERKVEKLITVNHDLWDGMVATEHHGNILRYDDDMSYWMTRECW